MSDHTHSPAEERRIREAALDETLADTFPASDPPSSIPNPDRHEVADVTVAAESCVALGATEHQFESYPGHDIALGALTVTRVLPVKGRRLVGPWCFLDRFGPLTFTDPLPMDVGA